MAKSKLAERVQLVWPKTGATARPLMADAETWLKQGWKTAKEAENGDEK